MEIKLINQKDKNGIDFMIQGLQLYNDIYIEVLYDRTVYYLIVSTYDVLNNTNNQAAFPEIRKLLEEAFGTKVNERYVL